MFHGSLSTQVPADNDKVKYSGYCSIKAKPKKVCIRYIKGSLVLIHAYMIKWLLTFCHVRHNIICRKSSLNQIELMCLPMMHS